LKCEPVGFHKRSHLSVVRLLKSFPDQPALRRAARWRTIPTPPQLVNTQPRKKYSLLKIEKNPARVLGPK
ncbi:hypothetical protein, partial [Laribacter hongkongensis]|uniref:hypothetical protein n=1 Tax=Laribacter hongkongensis TaxID=168471 RepID=UPI001EFD627E